MNLVLRDLTCVLFDQKLIVQLMNQHSCQHTLTVQQCRILLTDIACCSLMRLDMTSMDKLWDLMIMLFKWQLTMIRDTPSRLLELTFRHMDGVAKLMPEMKKTLLVDSTKRCLIDFWDLCTDNDMLDLLATLCDWMAPFNVKISILIRSGLQLNDGTFEMATEQLDTEHFRDYLENIGENIYARNAITAKSKLRSIVTPSDLPRNASISNELSTLASQLNIENDIVDDVTGKTTPSESIELDTVESKGDLIVDDENCSVSTENVKTITETSEFICLNHTTSALQGYLQQFELENKKTISGNGDDTQPFDATEELLKMLEDKDNADK